MSPKTKLLLKIFCVLLVILIISINFCRGQEFLIDDYYLTNQNYNLNELIDFLKLFKNNKFTDKEIEFIYNQAEYFDEHPLFILSWMEKESGIVRNPPPEPRYTKLFNLCMGYGLSYKKRIYGNKKYKYYSFEVQVLMACLRFREYYEKWKPGIGIKIINLDKVIYPVNAATYSLLVMNPFYGINYTYDRESGGVEIFVKIYNYFEKVWTTKKLN